MMDRDEYRRMIEQRLVPLDEPHKSTWKWRQDPLVWFAGYCLIVWVVFGYLMYKVADLMYKVVIH